ncbi:MAG: hypothetical protein V1492_00255 [Candidatus Micrarchaeota archaeon]
MLEQKNPFGKLVVVYLLWMASIVFGNIWLLYFKAAGLSQMDLALSFLFWPLPALLSIWLFSYVPKIDYRVVMAFGALLAALSNFIIVIFPPSPLLLFVSSFLSGATCFFFWVPLNIKYFGASQQQAATLGTVYFSLSSILGIVVPVLGGGIWNAFGSQAFFLVAGTLFLLPAAAVFILEKGSYKHELGEALKETKGFKTLNFIEGLYGGILISSTLISLTYFKDPLYFGIFFSATTLFSVIASLFVSRMSDKTRKRRGYIAATSGLTGLATVAMGFATNLVSWYAAVGIRNFFSILFWPFTTAIIVDNRRDLSKLMVGREFMLNVGRVFGVVAVIAFQLVFSSVYPALAALGWVLALYPLVLELKRKHVSVE